jgi:hypothetical protein
MLDIVGWSRRFNIQSNPWLIVGKGPTFRKVREIDLSGYHVCSLNHVVRELPVTLAHIIDIDVVADCAGEIYQNAKFLVMPYRPHIKNYPSSKTLADFIAEIQVLEAMEKEGRLVWYNLSSSSPHLDSPIIKAVNFSSEAALNLLVTAGATEVRTLGVDGGQSYSEAFDDLRSRTLLVNGQESFDKQFGGICETIRKSRVLYAPLHIEAPIRIFVGADAAQSLGVKMLEYSIKRHTPVSVALERIDDVNIPVPRKPQNRSRSGFSFSRFDIPRRCGYRGKAIYMDADMQVFSDVTRLWTWEMNDAAVLYCDGQADLGRPPQFSVMLMDCSRLPWDAATIVRELDAGKYTYEELMQDLCIVPGNLKKKVLPFEWNSLEHYEEGRTCLIHYTDMNTQPWVSNNNPNSRLWYHLLKEALLEGFITGEELRAEIDQGHVSPQLPHWAELPDIGQIANSGKEWIAPYKRFLKDDSKVSNVQSPRGADSRGPRWLGRLRRLLHTR